MSAFIDKKFPVRVIANSPLTLTKSGANYVFGIETSGGSSVSTSIDTISALRGVTPTTKYDINVLGHTNEGDGGGGKFHSDTGQPAGTYADNGGTIIVPTGGDGSSAWIRSNTNNTFDVSWFGAIPNGSVSQLPGINAALAALMASGKQGTLRFSPSISGLPYLIDGPIVIGDGATTFDIIVEGWFVWNAELNGPSSAIIQSTSATADVFQINSWTSNICSINFKGINIDCNSTTGAGINITNTGQLVGFKLENSVINGQKALAVNANVVSPRFTNVTFFATLAMDIAAEIDNAVWDQCIYQACGTVAHINATILGSAFNSCVFESCTSHVFTTTKTGSAIPFLSDVAFNSCWYETNQSYAYYIPAVASVGMSNVRWNNCHINMADWNTDFIYTETGTGNYSQNLDFYSCQVDPGVSSRLLNVDTDPTVVLNGGYYAVTMIDTWNSGQQKPKGIHTPATSSPEYVCFGFVPEAGYGGIVPLYIYNGNGNYNLKTQFLQSMSIPASRGDIDQTTYTVTDYDQTLIFTGLSTCTVTLPDPTTCPGQLLYMMTKGVQTVVSASANVVPLHGGAASVDILDSSTTSWALLSADSINSAWQIIQSTNPLPIAPTAVSGLLLYCDMGNPNGYVIDTGTSLKQWTDLSGNGNHLINNDATHTSQPTLLTPVANGITAVRFTAANSQKFDFTSSPLNLGSTDWTVIMVVERGGPAGTNVVELFGNTGTPGTISIEWNSSGHLYAAGTTHYVESVSNETDQTKYHVIAATFVGGAAQKIFFDGDFISVTSTAYVQSNSFDIFGFGNNIYSNCDFRSFAVWNSALSDQLILGLYESMRIVN